MLATLLMTLPLFSKAPHWLPCRGRICHRFDKGVRLQHLCDMFTLVSIDPEPVPLPMWHCDHRPAHSMQLPLLYIAVWMDRHGRQQGSDCTEAVKPVASPPGFDAKVSTDEVGKAPAHCIRLPAAPCLQPRTTSHSAGSQLPMPKPCWRAPARQIHSPAAPPSKLVLLTASHPIGQPLQTIMLYWRAPVPRNRSPVAPPLYPTPRTASHAAASQLPMPMPCWRGTVH